MKLYYYIKIIRKNSKKLQGNLPKKMLSIYANNNSLTNFNNMNILTISEFFKLNILKNKNGNVYIINIIIIYKFN